MTRGVAPRADQFEGDLSATRVAGIGIHQLVQLTIIDLAQYKATQTSAAPPKVETPAEEAKVRHKPQMVTNEPGRGQQPEQIC